MSIRATATGEIIEYIQRVGGRTTSFHPDDIVHAFSARDPDNPLFGMGNVEGVLYDIAGDLEAAKSNWAFFANG